MNLGDREQTVLETLLEIPKDNVVMIGGYAVNAYVPPRFSIDCDLVVLGETRSIENFLKKKGFDRLESSDIPHRDYIRYEMKSSKVSFDLLLGSVLDNSTGILFEGSLFRQFSSLRKTIGRSFAVRIEMKIADPELLFALKFVSARRQDIRDIFMLSATVLKWQIVKELITSKCNERLLRERVEQVKKVVFARSYRDSLQGSYGKIPDNRYKVCLENISKFLNEVLSSYDKRETNE